MEQHNEKKAIMKINKLCKEFHIKSGKFMRSSQILYALNDISLDVYEGETLGIIGESGCGKSTLGRCIVRLHKPTSGEIIYNDEDISKLKGNDSKRICKDIQMIFQDPFSSLNPRKTAGQLIAEPMIIHKMGLSKKERNDKVIKLMREVGLDVQHFYRFPHEFSGGQRQRVNIARALALDSKIIVCDEPVSALDVSIQAQVLNLLNELQSQRNLTYIFISHDLGVIKHISDKIVIMYLGKIVELCNAKDIYDVPMHPYTQALLSAIPPKNPFENKKRIMLEGEIPSPIGMRKYCPLSSRCPKVMDKCRNNMPELKKVDKNHQVACFLYD